MLIYLDAMIVQYIADHIQYILHLDGYLSPEEVDSNQIPKSDPKYLLEIEALGRLAFLEQLGNDWCYAVTPHLLAEIHAGQPTPNQVEFYDVLTDSWNRSGWVEAFPLDDIEVERTERSLVPLGLRDPADRRHLAQATVLNAAWFLTNDSEVINKCRKAKLPLRVCRPSECLEGMSVGLFLSTE